jgi:hypothetical protein
MDDFSQFIKTYREYVRIITPKVMFEKIGEVDDEIADASICWAVTDNMEALLALNPRATITEISDPREISEFLRKELTMNALITVLQDPNSHDHWFALIGDHGYVHIVEYLPNRCNSSETMDLDSFLIYFMRILRGVLPDRFYGSRDRHIYSMWSFSRRRLNRDTVMNFITQ